MPHIAETELDARALAAMLWRRAWLFLLLAAIAAAATYVGLGYVEPLYTADTRILIEERESPLTRPREQGAPSSSDFDESAIQSQVEVLRSREIANSVVDDLNLDRRPEFDPATRPSLLDSLFVMLGLREHPADGSVRQRVLDGFEEHLSVYALAGSRVIGVEFEAPAPELAAEVANAVAEAFVDLQQQATLESAVAATAWLEREIERLRARLAEAEQAVADYRQSNALFDAGASGNLSQQQLGDLNAELVRARAARAEAEARAELIQSLLAEGGALEAAEEVLDSQLIQRLRERQVALRAQIAELSTTLLPGHPRIRALQGQLQNLDAQIRLEAQKVQASLSTAARVAAAREQSLMASLDTAMSAVSLSNEQEIELRALEREAAAQRDLLETFLARYREAVARTDGSYLPADARIISRAVAPQEPSYPKRTMMAVAAAVATLLFALTIVLMREFTSGRAFRIVDDRHSPPREREPNVQVAALLSVTDARTDAPDGLLEGPAAVAPDDEPEFDFAAADDEALVVPPAPGDRPGTTELAEILASPGVRVALFAGAEGGEGAGDIAFAAARRAAQENLRLVLIDVGREPSAALGGAERPGLGDLLSGEAAFGDVIRRDETSRVHVIPMGGGERDAPLQRLQLVIGALTHTYDKVVIVADRLDDWPHAHVQPDLAAIVCEPDTTELLRTELYDKALERGARNALIVRYSSEHDGFNSGAESEAA